MKTLVIGAAGFVGGHLVREFESSGLEIVVSDVEAALPALQAGRHKALAIDILAPESIRYVLEAAKPQWIVLLDAQSSVGKSWEDPAGTVCPNILGSVNVLEAIRKSGLKPRILLIGSSEEYGMIRDCVEPLAEDRPLAPSNPYAITKTCQEDFGRLYHKAYGLEIVMARAFNHIGPGQRPGFVVPDFCSSIVAIERGLAEPILRVGNLTATRDFTDVRDVVRAYRFLLERGIAGESYNVGSGRAVAISALVEALISLAHVPLKTETDPNKFRPVEVKTIVADIRKIQKTTGWRPEIAIETSLAESLESWRQMRT